MCVENARKKNEGNEGKEIVVTKGQLTYIEGESEKGVQAVLVTYRECVSDARILNTVQHASSTSTDSEI